MRLIDADTLVNQCKEYSELLKFDGSTDREWATVKRIIYMLNDAPTIEPEQIVRCKDCKHWKRQTAYNGNPLSFGFCESDYMWRSLYGETYEVSHIDTDDDFYCGYAERKDT